MKSYRLSSVVLKDMEISIHELKTILNRVVTRREFSIIMIHFTSVLGITASDHVR